MGMPAWRRFEMTVRLNVASPPRAVGDVDALSTCSDEQLLERYVTTGDVEAFTAIVVRHGPRVLGVSRCILTRPHDVEDAFQGTFLLLARKAGTIRRGGSLGHWLHGVAHRLAVRSKLKASRREALERKRRETTMAVRHQEDDEMDRGEMRRVVHEEIDRLPARLREAILLCYLEGHTNDSAARLLGCPPSTLKERLARGREVLRGRLERRGLGLSIALFVLLLPETPAAAAVPRRLINRTVSRATAGRKVRRGGSQLAVRGWPGARLVWIAAAAVVMSSAVTAGLYAATPERVDFLTWLAGAIRRACH
jgi:RNA polymerase sigma factor (sigma-70 family)